MASSFCAGQKRQSNCPAPDWEEGDPCQASESCPLHVHLLQYENAGLVPHPQKAHQITGGFRVDDFRIRAADGTAVDLQGFGKPLDLGRLGMHLVGFIFTNGHGMDTGHSCQLSLGQAVLIAEMFDSIGNCKHENPSFSMIPALSIS